MLRRRAVGAVKNKISLKPLEGYDQLAVILEQGFRAFCARSLRKARAVETQVRKSREFDAARAAAEAARLSR